MGCETYGRSLKINRRIDVVRFFFHISKSILYIPYSILAIEPTPTHSCSYIQKKSKQKAHSFSGETGHDL